jgi:FKBP-type peptidyl-prolyl cis-trans isomerase FklB
VWADAAATALTSEQDKISYTIGADIGQSLKAQDVQIDAGLVAKGLSDAYGGKKLLMSQDEMKKTITDLQKQVVDKQQAKMKNMADKNSKKGDDFLAKNKTKAGIVALPSGLQYKVVTAGKGQSPSENSTVKVDYEGKLLDGKVFDSTYKRGEPVEFKVSQVIPGWQEALQKMKQGATWELFIPAKLAYGERGFMNPGGTSIEPNETLVFKVHLISVMSDAKAKGKAKN